MNEYVMRATRRTDGGETFRKDVQYMLDVFEERTAFGYKIAVKKHQEPKESPNVYLSYASLSSFLDDWGNLKKVK